MYSYSSHFGGILLRSLFSGRTIMIQPGDDTSYFLDEIENAEKLPEDKALSRIQDIINEYFELIEDNN